MPAVKEHSAGGLVAKGGKVLLVKVTNLKGEEVWCFPKGHLEKGETAEQAAVREVTEETGWRCKSLGPILTVGYFFKRQGRLVSKKVDWFLMEADQKVGVPDAVEVHDVQWAPVAKAKTLLQYPTDVQVLEKWLEGKKGV
jgi:8-oxo-dGTP pyrophosphatase MutT (NUDIX family)